MKRLNFGKLILGTAALWILACLVFAGVIAYRFLSPYLGGDSLKTQISKLKASGEPVTMAELVGPAIPNSQNAALIYQKAFTVMGFPKNKGQFVVKIDSLLADKNSGKTDVYPKMAQFVAQYELVLPVVEKAAAYKKCRFAVNWEAGFDANLDHLEYLRCLSKLLMCTAIVEAHRGRMESAVRSCELGLKVSNALQGEPSALSFLTRIGLINNACSSIEGSLEAGNITKAQARRLHNALSAIDLNAHYKLALRGERIQGIGFFERLSRGQIGPAKDSGSETKLGFSLEPFMRPDQTYFFKAMQKQIDCVDVPYRVLKSRHNNKIIGQDMPRNAPFSFVFVSVSGRMNASRDSAIANIGVSQIALALNVFHNATGAYPKFLSGLQMEPSLKLNLQDPFSGKYFVYQRKGMGCILYSIGRNLKDEGGLDDFTIAQRAMHPRPDRPDDIAWKIDR